MELYGPRAAQYQYHGRAEVTPRGRSASTLSACNSNEDSKKQHQDNETPMEEIVLGAGDGLQEQIELVDADTSPMAVSSEVRGKGSTGSEQSGGEVVEDIKSHCVAENEIGAAVGLSASDTARVYLRQLLEGTGMAESGRNIAVAANQPAAEPSGQEGVEENDENVVTRIAKSIGNFTIMTTQTGPPSTTSDMTMSTLAVDSSANSESPAHPNPRLDAKARPGSPTTLRSPSLIAHEEETEDKYEVKSFQRMFDPGSANAGAASSPGQTVGRGALHASFPTNKASSARFSSSGSSISSGHSAGSKKSSASQTPSQRTRNLKQKRRGIRSKSSQSAGSVDLDQIMPTGRRKRRQGSSGSSVSSGMTFQSTELNLCPIDEDPGSHDEYTEGEVDEEEEEIFDDKALRRSSGLSDITDEDVRSLRSRQFVQDTDEKDETLTNAEGEGSAKRSHVSTANDSLSLLFNGRKIPKHTAIDPDVVPDSISWKHLDEEGNLRIHADDYTDGGKRLQNESSNTSSWRQLWNAYTKNNPESSSDGDSFRLMPEGIRLVGLSDEESDSDRYVTTHNSSNNNGETDRPRSRQSRLRLLVKERSVRARKVFCVFVFVPLMAVAIFFTVSTNLNNARPEEEQEATEAPIYDHLQDLDALDQDKIEGSGEQYIEFGHQAQHASVLESIITTLGPSVGTNLFNAEEGTPQYSALSWVLNEDPLQLGDYLADAEHGPMAPHDLADLQLQLVQRFVLATLYYSSVPKIWRNSTSWLSQTHECEWFGVSCENHFSHGDGHETATSDAQGRQYPAKRLKNAVTMIDLQENSVVLSGGIPQELKALKQLQELVLSNNQIAGEIGPWVGDMSSLEVLHLDGNELTGDIPNSLTKLHALLELRLENNSFVATEVPRGCAILTGYQF